MSLPSPATGVRAASRFLDDHWILKWFVVPIWFMAAILLVLFVGVSTASEVESVQVVGLFVGFSLGIVLVGLAVERLVARVTGVDILHRRNHD